MAVGVKALGVAKGVSYVLSGVPDYDVADAMSRTGRPEEVAYIIRRHKSERRTRESMNGDK